jgi:tripartite-type tricarboxylate transporter receptor subunit TctC
VALLPSVPHWFIARKNLPPKDFKEFIAYLKENSGKVTAASVGAGGSSAVCGYYFGKATGTSTTLVPYRGGAPALQDIVAGNVDMMCDLAANSLGQVRAGTIKAYAVTSKKRWFAAPELPTAERGRRARSRSQQLARRLCAQGHAEGHRRQAEQCVFRRHGRSGGAPADRRSGHGGAAARAADPGRLRGVFEIRDGQMGRDHPRVRHQGAMKPVEHDVKALSFVALIFVAGAIAGAQAQTYPSRPITLIAPTSPGGPPDTIGRILAEHMKVTLGQPVIVENVTGAGGSIGVTRVARSAPDGYTVSIGHLNTHVFTGAVYNLSFDLLKDLGAGDDADVGADVVRGAKGFPAEQSERAGRLDEGAPEGRHLRFGRPRQSRQGLGYRI